MDSNKSKSKRSPALIKAQENYNKKRTGKKVWFNTDTESHLINEINEIDNLSRWIKTTIQLLIDAKKAGLVTDSKDFLNLIDNTLSEKGKKN